MILPFFLRQTHLSDPEYVIENKLDPIDSPINYYLFASRTIFDNITCHLPSSKISNISLFSNYEDDLRKQIEQYEEYSDMQENETRQLYEIHHIGSFYLEIGKSLLGTQNKSTESSENMTRNEYFHKTNKKLTSVVHARQCKRVKFARKKFASRCHTRILMSYCGLCSQP